jgi:hypothetical protein
MLLGAWVTYFGVLLVVLGLYTLNCLVLVRRVGQVERQAQQLRALQGQIGEQRLTPDEIALLERYVSSPRLWRARLARLPEVLPAGARLSTAAFNPQGTSGGEALVLAGVLRPQGGQDRMGAVTGLVETLRADTVFARGYGSIRLVSTRMAESDADLLEFTIECR